MRTTAARVGDATSPTYEASRVNAAASASSSQIPWVATTTAGQVRQISLRVRFTFKLRTPSDRELIGPTELLLGRDISYNESDALAKEQEEALLYREMQTDIVSQLMRRLAAVPAL